MEITSIEYATLANAYSGLREKNIILLDAVESALQALRDLRDNNCANRNERAEIRLEDGLAKYRAWEPAQREEAKHGSNVS